MKFRTFVLVALAVAMSSALGQSAPGTTFFTSIGDLVFQMTPPKPVTGVPGTIDNMAIGQTTPEPGTFNGLSLIQGAPVNYNVASTFAVSDITGSLITSTPAAAIALTLPLATAMDSGLPSAELNWSVDFFVLNLSSTAANTDTITTNTGWTLVGNMVVTPVTGGTSAHFRARRTAVGAWTLYRLS